MYKIFDKPTKITAGGEILQFFRLQGLFVYYAVLVEFIGIADVPAKLRHYGNDGVIQQHKRREQR